jgi:RNA polymerase primary sigma factor
MRELQITQSITNRETRAVQRYLNDIGKVSPISAEEEVNLARRIKLGDQEALEKLTKTNLRFVVSVAKKYQNHSLPLGDLISEGNLGLIRAAKKFDETRGFKFISYAVWWIRQSILQAIAEQSRTIRLPLSQIGVITRVNKALSSFEQTTGRIPTQQELAEFMDFDKEKISDAMCYAPKATSIDAPFQNGEDDFGLLDTIANQESPTDGQLIQEYSFRELHKLLGILSDREKRIIELSFGLNGEGEMMLTEISDFVGLSPERVRQIKNQAIQKLRQHAIFDTL